MHGPEDVGPENIEKQKNASNLQKHNDLTLFQAGKQEIAFAKLIRGFALILSEITTLKGKEQKPMKILKYEKQ